jgi:hypothetical protein
MGVLRYSSLGSGYKSQAAVGQGRVKRTKLITAETGAVLGAKFALRFAEMCGFSTLAVA